MSELLDVVDERGIPTGEVVSREEAHRCGIRHRTAHVWIVRIRGGRLQILLQKRSENKDSYPGCYDISSAGHIPAGVEYVDSAVRELREELGVCALPEELVYCGQRQIRFEEMFHGELFRDKQVSNIYMLWLDRDENDFVIQEEELSCVKWFDYEACVRAVRENTIPHCIYVEELEMVRTQAERSRLVGAAMEYTVVRIDGDYAYLKNETKETDELKCVARALLPAEIREGSRLVYEMFEYRMA